MGLTIFEVVERYKKPGETRSYTVDFQASLEKRWQRNRKYAAGVYVRPTEGKANGFEYECTTAGMTAGREPNWRAALAATVTDGSAVWTARQPGTLAVDTISGSAIVTAIDSGITATHISTDASGQALIRVSGGSDLGNYIVRVTATTTSGDVYQQDITFKVRDKDRAIVNEQV